MLMLILDIFLFLILNINIKNVNIIHNLFGGETHKVMFTTGIAVRRQKIIYYERVDSIKFKKFAYI